MSATKAMSASKTTGAGAASRAASAVAELSPDPFVIRLIQTMNAYARATGAVVCALDRDCRPLAGAGAVLDRAACRLCTRAASSGIASGGTAAAYPCHKLHADAAREAHQYGGSHIYLCDLGFLFWTSPIFRKGDFAGALVATGFLGVPPEETAALLRRRAAAAADSAAGADLEAVIESLIKRNPGGEARRVGALARLLLACAESLSPGSGAYYETLRRRARQQSDITFQIERLKGIYPPGAPPPPYPLAKERILLASLRRGDHEAGRAALNELLAAILFANPLRFRAIQYRAMELVILLSRTAISPGYNPEALLAANDSFLRRVQEAAGVEDLVDTLHIMVDHFSGRISSFQGIRHAQALRKAEWFIWEHYTRKLSLDEIAGAAGLSAPYFSTIFKEEMGENLSSYLNRLRIEKAAAMLTETGLSLSKIAGACGFEDQSWFSKTFKTFTGVSPGRYRAAGGIPVDGAGEVRFADDYQRLARTEEDS